MQVVEGYFVNTTSGSAITMKFTSRSPSAGAYRCCLLIMQEIFRTVINFTIGQQMVLKKLVEAALNGCNIKCKPRSSCITFVYVDGQQKVGLHVQNAE